MGKVCHGLIHLWLCAANISLLTFLSRRVPNQSSANFSVCLKRGFFLLMPLSLPRQICCLCQNTLLELCRFQCVADEIQQHVYELLKCTDPLFVCSMVGTFCILGSLSLHTAFVFFKLLTLQVLLSNLKKGKQRATQHILLVWRCNTKAFGRVCPMSTLLGKVQKNGF
jgi:hypothetical protein